MISMQKSIQMEQWFMSTKGIATNTINAATPMMGVMIIFAST
jgi:hypothetical protein